MLKFIFGSRNDRYLKKARPVVETINTLEPRMKALSDSDFPAKITAWKQQVAQGRNLNDLLPEVFAIVREAGRRKLNMRHFDCQLIGGLALHEGKIAEMKTGEGKTLVATLAVVLNALSGCGIHVVTVNDYLAKRDVTWMGVLYNFLGLSTGVIVNGLTDIERQQNYNADVTYGTNNEFGFDYLRDNMKFYKNSLVQRELKFAIVDEVDSILVDEARTPLIISGPYEQFVEQYRRVESIISAFKRSSPRPPDFKNSEDFLPNGDFEVDEKNRNVTITDRGVEKAEKLLNVANLFDPANITLQHHILQGLKAHYLYKRDVDYIVKDGQVIIVDEFTGRLMPGRRYSDGLHQALEAKESVEVEAENQTLASITFQNFFRMYDKLAGMTGTADTEAVEFKEIYNLDVVVVPPNKPMVRKDHPDMIFKTQAEKFKSIAVEIEDCYRRGQPVLVGTVSIEKSELVSGMLKNLGIPHNVLNAKQHAKEAEIIAEAGQRGKVTIATNMAGRGTDILISAAVRGLGGLHIIGTERHESRRIDNQLRGRAGRQGDPGSSRFYLALDDNLMRLFGSDRIAGLMDKLGMEKDVPIENRLVSRAIEGSQRRVEGHNFEIRKQLLDFDNVMNQQREVIYSKRRELMHAECVDKVIEEYANDVLMIILGPTYEDKYIDYNVAENIYSRLAEIFAFDRFPGFRENVPDKDRCLAWLEEIIRELKAAAKNHYQEIVRYCLLEALDRNWKEHLLGMDHLRDGIGLRGYGQKDPRQEYKLEGFRLFSDMLENVKVYTLHALCHLRIKAEIREGEFQHKEIAKGLHYIRGGESKNMAQKPKRRYMPNIGPNTLCPCGSGKKYKKCCRK